MDKRPILIAGLPRAGTTWQYKTLLKASNFVGLFEPDNCKINPFALYFYQNCHRFPENKVKNKDLLEFWKQVFKGGWKQGFCNNILKRIYLRDLNNVEFMIQYNSNRLIPQNNLISFLSDLTNMKPKVKISGLKTLNRFCSENKLNQRILVKSVHCIRQLEWLFHEFQPRIILITRNLLNLIASYTRLKFPDSLRGIPINPPISMKINNNSKEGFTNDLNLFCEIVIQACELTRKLVGFKESYPESILIKHESACINPKKHFKQLFKSLNLEWTENVGLFLEEINREGSGFQTQRLIKNEQCRYLDQLDKTQIGIIKEYADIYGLNEFV